MSKFNVNFRDLTNSAIWFFLRTSKFLSSIFSMIKPLSTLNNDGIIVEFLGQKQRSLFHFQLFIRNLLFFDARTNLLEKFLNDFWDPVNQGIEIINDNTSHVLYLFNKAEERADVFFYNLWDSAFAYKINVIPVTGDFAVFENKVYQAKTDNTNKQPDLNPSDWDFVKDITFLFNLEDEFPVDYRIDIPLAVTAQPEYSDERIKSQINLFNAAGRTYKGVEKGSITNIFFTNIQ